MTLAISQGQWALVFLPLDYERFENRVSVNLSLVGAENGDPLDQLLQLIGE